MANPCEQPAKYSRLYSPNARTENGIGLSLSVSGEPPVDLARVDEKRHLGLFEFLWSGVSLKIRKRGNMEHTRRSSRITRKEGDGSDLDDVVEREIKT
jgi:hypothetical protein